MSQLRRYNFIPRNLHISEDTVWRGDLQVHGDLLLGGNLHVCGNLEVTGKIHPADFENKKSLTVEGNLLSKDESIVKILVIMGNAQCDYILANDGTLIQGDLTANVFALGGDAIIQGSVFVQELEPCVSIRDKSPYNRKRYPKLFVGKKLTARKLTSEGIQLQIGGRIN